MASASAASFTVTRFDDPVPGACDPSDCSLREAVIAANAAAGSDTIVLPAGIYTLTIPDSTESSGATDATRGDLDVTDALEIETSGGSAGIDAGARFSVGASSISITEPGTTARVLHVVSTSLTTTSLGVKGGSADPGAGIQVENGSLNMSGGVLLNVANGTCCGGGIGAIASNVVLAGTRISNNAVAMCCGGGIYNESSSVTIQIAGVQTADVLDNDAFGCCGAGIYNWSNPNAPRTASLSLATVNFSGNDVRDCCGGAIYNEEGGPTTVTMTRAVFMNNLASDDCCGGAIYSKPSATVNASDARFSDNTRRVAAGVRSTTRGRLRSSVGRSRKTRS